MRIYMIYQEDEEENICDIIGFFDTEEKAETEVIRLREENNTDEYYYYEYGVR